MPSHSDRLPASCPIAWPAAPRYPIDAVSNSLQRNASQSPVKSDDIWLRRNYFDTLYGAGSLDEVNERIARLGRVLRDRSEAVAEALCNASLMLETFDRKYRPDVLKTLDDSQDGVGPLKYDERLALKQAIERNANPAAPEGEHQDRPKKRSSSRETLAQLEIVETKMQVLLLLEMLARRQSGTLRSLDPDPLLRLYTDRLAIHQAMSGIAANMSSATAASKESELDDVQLFWRAMEDIYLSLVPPIFVELIRDKLFTRATLTRLGMSDASGKAVASPMHHPTPDLRKLAQAVSDAAAENAANRVPESPTLAKFFGNPVNAGTATSTATGNALVARSFARSRSTMNTSHLSMRQVEMGVRPSVMPTSTISQLTARPNKRKAAEPERIPPHSSASQIFISMTPQRAMGRILAAETPAKDLMDESDFEIPATPA